MPSTGWLIGGAILAFLLGVGIGTWRVWTLVPRLWPFGTGADAPPASVDEVFAIPEGERDALRSLTEEHDELQALYESIGYSPVLEQKVDRILNALRASITVEIPDYEAFQEALEEARTEMSLLPDQEAFDDEAAQEDMNRATELLEEVWRRRDTPAAVVEKLQEAPLERQLPYVERVPVTRDGTVHWRTPVRVSVLRKRPADTQQFRRRLDRLAALVKNASLSRDDQIENELRAAIGRLRQDVEEEDVYVPMLLNRLEEAAAAWLNEAPRRDWRHRKERLDACLVDVYRLRMVRPHLTGEGAALNESLRDDAEARYRKLVISWTRTYVNEEWMHTAWLTDQLLVHLLTLELLNASGTSRRQLSIIVEEVQSRGYDPQESMRRLRKYEEERGFVQSLAFALLRLRQEKQPVSTS